jgi:hypothetical protein
MNNDEEILWNYIDGICTADEQLAVSNRIAADEAFRLKYNELLSLNTEFSQMELDEPSMAFTFNVIEDIRALEAQKPLKTTVNKRIILGIALFFVCTIVGLLVYTLSTINWSVAGQLVIKTPGINIPKMASFITKPVLDGFVFFDIVLALFLFDHFFRKKSISNVTN